MGLNYEKIYNTFGTCVVLLKENVCDYFIHNLLREKVEIMHVSMVSLQNFLSNVLYSI